MSAQVRSDDPTESKNAVDGGVPVRKKYTGGARGIKLRYCCLPNICRCGQIQEEVWDNCPLLDRLYPAEWMAETLFHTVEHPS